MQTATLSTSKTKTLVTVLALMALAIAAGIAFSPLAKKQFSAIFKSKSRVPSGYTPPGYNVPSAPTNLRVK